MANIIFISWMPWVWKTTTSKKIRDEYDKDWTGYLLLPLDETYIEFINKYGTYRNGLV